jgi:hypothetical protein
MEDVGARRTNVVAERIWARRRRTLFGSIHRKARFGYIAKTSLAGIPGRCAAWRGAA